MHPSSSLIVVAGLLSTLPGCARSPEGSYDPGAFEGQPLVYAPEVTEGGPEIQLGEASSPDSDGDGVPDDEEAELGLDPQSADSDGDGYLDGEELAANSDPLDITHHPYTGGWAIDACNRTLEPSGDSVGSVTEDFALLDQNGELVRLHDFCDRAVLLVTSAMWCEPCQDEASELQHWYETYAEQGLMVITLLVQDEGGATPDEADLARWADTYSLAHPVLADANFEVSDRWGGNYIPTMHLLAPGAVVVAGDTFVDEGTLQANLP